jgi:hypothetical protein
MYCYDTFRWIETHNPAQVNIPIGSGLNLYGPTIVSHVGAYAFHAICHTWAQLFMLGPPNLLLSQGQSTIIGDDNQTQQWRPRRLTIERDGLVQTFTTLANYGRQAQSGDYFILHLGV